LYGASKAGKSTLAATTVEPRLMFDVEAASRFLPIKRVVWDPSDPPPEYDGSWDTAVVNTRSWKDVERGYQWLASGRHPFRSVIIDSISELQNRFLEQEAGRTQPTMQNYGAAYRAVGGLVRDIRDLTVHPINPITQVVMVAMARQGQDGRWHPWLVGQVATVLPYLLDVTGYLYIDPVTDPLSGEVTETRKLLTRATSDFEAGERVGGRIPRIVENPRLDQMLTLVFPAEGAESSLPEPEPELEPTAAPVEEVAS
jgi:hypothetical protein